MWSTPRLFVRKSCSREGGGPHHLLTFLRHGVGNEFSVGSTFCHMRCPYHRYGYDSVFVVARTQWDNCMSNSFPFLAFPTGSFLQSGTLTPLLPEDHRPFGSSMLKCAEFTCMATLKTCSSFFCVLFRRSYLIIFKNRVIASALSTAQSCRCRGKLSRACI